MMRPAGRDGGAVKLSMRRAYVPAAGKHITRYRFCFLALVTAVGVAACGSEKDLEPFAQLSTTFDSIIPNSMRRHKVPGATVALVEEGKVVWARGFGVADRENGRSTHSQTMFNVASLSKPVTALAIMRLAEQGKLDLDEPVSSYLTRWQLPESEFDSDGVTPRAILSHTAGLSMPSVPAFAPTAALPELVDILDGNYTGSDYASSGTRVEILYPPGEAFHYSGGGYVLLELLVEEITGKSFRDYMSQEVLKPLGMSSGRFGWDDEVAERAAVPYGREGKPQPLRRFPATAGSGLYTDVSEFATLIGALLTGGGQAGRGVVSPDGLRTMFEPVELTHRASKFELPAMGLGFFATKYPKLISHIGGNRGWRARFVALPESGQAIVVLTNSDRGSELINDVVCAWVGIQLGAKLLEGC